MRNSRLPKHKNYDTWDSPQVSTNNVSAQRNCAFKAILVLRIIHSFPINICVQINTQTHMAS